MADLAAWAKEQEEKFYSDINSTEIDLAEKFTKAYYCAILFSPQMLANSSAVLQRCIFVLEDGLKILLQNDDSFTKVFEFLKSRQESTDAHAFMMISNLYKYVTNLTQLLHKAGDREKAKMNFKKITKFCLLAVSRHKISAKHSIIAKTCNHLNQSMSAIKNLDI